MSLCCLCSVHSIDNARLYSELSTANKTLEAKVKKRTQALQRAVQQAHDAQATAESASAHKSMFLANMSHEIRTPMVRASAALTQLAHTFHHHQHFTKSIVHCYCSPSHRTASSA